MNREEVELKVLEWAKDRDLLHSENALKQVLKTGSEFGELCDAIIKLNEGDIIDAIGDIEVCLTILKSQLGFTQNAPLLIAYDEIKNRTGKTVNGTFIKDSK